MPPPSTTRAWTRSFAMTGSLPVSSSRFAPRAASRTIRTLVILTGWPISRSRPVPACRLPNAAERYQEVRQAVTALPSMARAAPCGLSPEPLPEGPNADALTGTRTLGDGLAGGLAWPVLALDGPLGAECRCAAPPPGPAALAAGRREAAPNGLMTKMSAIASATHTSTSASGQPIRRKRPDLPGLRGRTGGGTSTANASTGSAIFRCARIRLRRKDGTGVHLMA